MTPSPPPRALVFAGGVRADSFNRRLARLVADHLPKHGIGVTFLDLRDYPMPLYDGDEEDGGGPPETVRQIAQAVASHSAFLIASPEYNGSFSALLKNVLDWISRPENGEPPCAVYTGKVAGIMSATPSRGGGLRGLRHLRELLEIMGARVFDDQLSIPAAHEAFSPDGRLARPEDQQALDRFTSRFAKALSQLSQPEQVTRNM